MTAHAQARDACRLGSLLRGDGEVVIWCLTHDAPPRHRATAAGTGPAEVGEVGRDPADVPRLSDLARADAEEQYAGRLPTAPADDRHNAMAMAAYRLLKDPHASTADRDTARGQLAVLRAQDRAASTTWDERPTLLPMGAECADCGGMVMRTAELRDELLVVQPWRHLPDPILSLQPHPVRRVTFPR